MGVKYAPIMLSSFYQVWVVIPLSRSLLLSELPSAFGEPAATR